MRAGAAAVDITPPVGTSLVGYFTDRRASGVHDPLFAKALVIENDGETVAFVACDLIALGREPVANLRRAAQDQCAIPAQNIMVSCTHTHLGPTVLDVFQCATDQGALERAVEGAVRAVCAAKRALRPVEARFSSGEAPGLAFNRRYRMTDSSVRTNPGFGPEVVAPAGPVDHEVRVLSFTGGDGEPVAALVNFGLHLDTIGGDAISADYPAVLAEVVRREWGGAAQVLFLNGPCGDINHINFLRREEPISGFERSRMIGEALGRKVVEVLPQGRPVAGRLRCASATVRLETRKVAADELQGARKVLEGAPPVGRMNTEQVWAHETVQVSLLPPSVEAEIQAVLVGDCALIGIPCEVFASLGLEIRRRSPFAVTGVVELANGYEGYLPAREAYEQGGYEPRAARSSKLAPGSGEAVVEVAVSLLHSAR